MGEILARLTNRDAIPNTQELQVDSGAVRGAIGDGRDLVQNVSE